MSSTSPTSPQETTRQSAAEWLSPLREAFKAGRSGRGRTTTGNVHIRERVNLRGMATVALLALLPCLLLGLYNTGLQINQAIAGGADYLPTWQYRIIGAAGISLLSADSVVACFLHGLIYFLPLWLVIHAAGRLSDLIFAAFRREPLHEGFAFISLLFAMTLSPTTPLWQAAVSIVFGNVMGKEVFGGAGRNLIHPVVLAWSFLWVSYARSVSGDADWFPVSPSPYSWLNIVGNEGPQVIEEFSWMTAFLGLTPGAFGQPAPVACLIGAAVLVAFGTASWRVLLAYIAGTIITSALMNQIDAVENFFMPVPFHWHMVLGAWAFGGAFLLTDMVTGAHTRAGRWMYGFAAGILVILVRVLNPTHTDGVISALLLANLFAATFDDIAIRMNIRKRKRRYETS